MSNQTVREAAQAVIDVWHDPDNRWDDEINRLRDALAQPDPETTLCGMDEKTLDLFIQKIKHAYEYAQDGLSSASMIDLKHAIALLPVERKTWTVPHFNWSTLADVDLPKGIEIAASLSDRDACIRCFIVKGDISLESGEKVNITDPDNPFIVGEQS